MHKKTLCPPCSQPPHRFWEAALRWHKSHLFSRLNKCWSLSFSYKVDASALTIAESQNTWCWQAPQEITWSSAPAQAEPPRAGCSALCPDSFWVSPRRKTLQPDWATCANAQSPSAKKVLPVVQMEPLVFQVSKTSLLWEGKVQKAYLTKYKIH